MAADTSCSGAAPPYLTTQWSHGSMVYVAPRGAEPEVTRRTSRRPSSRTASVDDKYKTELCATFSTQGWCPYTFKCRFAHGEDELRPRKRHPRYKTEACREFEETGRCSYGTRCIFIHREERPRAEEGEVDPLEVLLLGDPDQIAVAPSLPPHPQGRSWLLCLCTRPEHANKMTY